MTWTSLGGTAKIRGKCSWPPVTVDQDISKGDKYDVCRLTGLEECKHLRKQHSNEVTRFRYYRHV